MSFQSLCPEEVTVEAMTEAEGGQTIPEAEGEGITRDRLLEEAAIEISLQEKTLEADLLLKEPDLEEQDLNFKKPMIHKFMLQDFQEKLLSTI